MQTTSHHYLLDFYEVDNVKVLDDISAVEHIFLEEAIKKSGATYLNHHSHKFEPQGLSIVVMLAESHISIHTWPESKYAALDVYTCGSKEQADMIVEILLEHFDPKITQTKYVKRGGLALL